VLQVKRRPRAARTASSVRLVIRS